MSYHTTQFLFYFECILTNRLDAHITFDYFILRLKCFWSTRFVKVFSVLIAY